jgi:hypothetical protein
MVISVKLLEEGGQTARRAGVSVLISVALGEQPLRIFQRSEHYT